MRAPFLSLEDLNTADPEQLAASIAAADDEHHRLETEDKIESQEFARLDENIDNAHVVAAALTETADRLETSYPEGVPEEVVASLEPVLEALKNVVGFKPGSMKVSLEGLHGKERTRVAVEGLKETAKKIWEAIKAAFNRMIEFFKSIFTRQGRQRAAVEKKLDAALDAMKAGLGEHLDTRGGEEILYPLTCLVDGGKAASLQQMTQWVRHDAQVLLETHAAAQDSFNSFYSLCVSEFSDIKTIEDVRKAEKMLAEWATKDTDKLVSRFGGDKKLKMSMGGYAAELITSVRKDYGSDQVMPLIQFEPKVPDIRNQVSDAVSGPMLELAKAETLLNDVNRKVAQWPRDEDRERMAAKVNELHKALADKSEHFPAGESVREANELPRLIKEAMRRLYAYVKIMYWSHDAAMSCFMGIIGVCASSAVSNLKLNGVSV